MMVLGDNIHQNPSGFWLISACQAGERQVEYAPSGATELGKEHLSGANVAYSAYHN